jgi:hypothetical protein
VLLIVTATLTDRASPPVDPTEPAIACKAKEGDVIMFPPPPVPPAPPIPAMVPLFVKTTPFGKEPFIVSAGVAVLLLLIKTPEAIVANTFED